VKPAIHRGFKHISGYCATPSKHKTNFSLWISQFDSLRSAQYAPATQQPVIGRLALIKPRFAKRGLLRKFQVAGALGRFLLPHKRTENWF
jgi:hypothetical protein